MAITKKKFVRYTLFPEVLPRIRALFMSGFSFLANLIAVIYHNVGLLPPGHAYLDHQNYGRYGIRHVVAEAGRNLVFSRKHTDQIVIYFTILTGLMLLLLQIIFLVIAFVTSPVMAITWSDMFLNTPAGHTPSQDIAFIVLDNVFGIRALSGTASTTGFFNSCISDLGTGCIDIRGNPAPTPTAYPFPIHNALHQLLFFYTLGIAFIAGIIIIYSIIAIIGESITSGTPFGERTNRSWFIPRLIVFFALIAPISITPGQNNDGINVAQMIVFSVAKFGSNMGTNAWLRFNDSVAVAASEFFGQQQSMFAFPNVPEVGELTQFMHVVRLCMLAEKMVHGKEVLPYIVREHNGDSGSVNLHNGDTATYATMGGTTDDFLPFLSGGNIVPLDRAIIFSRYKNVILRFGHRNPPGAGAVGDALRNNPPGAYREHWGFVEPTCGELHFDIGSLDRFVIGQHAMGINQLGIQENYYLSIASYLRNDLSHPMIDITVLCMAKSILPYNQDNSCIGTPYAVATTGTVSMFPVNPDTQWITTEAANSSIEHFNASNKWWLAGEAVDWGTYARTPGVGVLNEMENAYETLTNPNNLLMSPQIRQRGWAGAAIWYNKVAEFNGITASAMQNLPIPFKYPLVMEKVAEQHKVNDSNFSYPDRFNPRLQNGKTVKLPDPEDQYLATLLYNDYDFWRTHTVQESVHTEASENSIIDGINMVLGTEGLADILENTDTHPMAMLSYIGKSMVDASMRNLFAGVVGQGIGKLLAGTAFAQLGDTAGEFLVTFSLITLSIGFMLYYVLPFLPFLYFFFAFGGWIKSIFEAVIAMPLWALAHIKLDGEGLPGPWATNGYYLLLEILLRPTMIVSGFLASIVVYSALVNTLNEVFHVVTLTVTGYDLEREIFSSTTLPGGVEGIQYWRSPLDELFYTALYAILVYMIGLSCFKLTDQVPNQILRWIGFTAKSFHETMADPAGKFSGQMFRSSRMTNAQITEMIARLKGDRASNAMTDEQVMIDMVGGPG